MTTFQLSREQEYAFSKFKRGENIFITGPGGTGKTQLIQSFVNHAREKNLRMQVCALTGCAALLLNCKARTIHSWSGIKIAKGTKADVIRAVLKNEKVVFEWLKTDILVIDEVSMMSQKIFEILEEIARLVRKNNQPFGGMQIVFSGDFFQLPPVGNPLNPETERFCFESEQWNAVFTPKNQIELVHIFRQNDPVYINILQEIRRGELSEENKTILQGYVRREFIPDQHDGIIPPKLFPVRNKVEFVNNAMFKKIDEPEYTFDCDIKRHCVTYIDNGKIFTPYLQQQCDRMTANEKDWEVEQICNSMPSPKTYLLKKGAIVMCTFNIDIDRGICNGSQGVIIDIIPKKTGNVPIVKFYNGIEMAMELHYWQSEEYPCIAVGQIPLCLSWAMTIHKIQGTTMDMAEMDIGHSIFEYGQIYVALSRIKSLNGLYLLNFHPHKIMANPKVIEFYKTLLEVTDADMDIPQSVFGVSDCSSIDVSVQPKKVRDPNVKIIRF